MTRQQTQQDPGSPKILILRIEQIDLRLPALDKTVHHDATGVHVLLHLVGRFGELVPVEVGREVLQVAAAEVVGEGDQRVELVLGQLLLGGMD